jgi:hypothetical protein
MRKNLLQVINARQHIFGIFGRAARLFQNFLLKRVHWPQKKRQNLFRKAAKLFRNLQVPIAPHGQHLRLGAAQVRQPS